MDFNVTNGESYVPVDVDMISASAVTMTETRKQKGSKVSYTSKKNVSVASSDLRYIYTCIYINIYIKNIYIYMGGPLLWFS